MKKIIPAIGLVLMLLVACGPKRYDTVHIVVLSAEYDSVHNLVRLTISHDAHPDLDMEGFQATAVTLPDHTVQGISAYFDDNTLSVLNIQPPLSYTDDGILMEFDTSMIVEDETNYAHIPPFSFPSYIVPYQFMTESVPVSVP